MNSSAVLKNGFKYIENRLPPTGILNPSLLFVNVRSFFRFRGNELYNVKTDPREKKNLLYQDSNQAEPLRKILLDHIRLENAVEQREIDEATLEKLKSLGYTQ
jgi:hypothetical protein